MKTYNQSIVKTVNLSYKIDGVQLVVENGYYSSRAGKPMYNLPAGLADGLYEVFLGNFAKSMQACRYANGTTIDFDCIFSLYPIIDERLDIGDFESLDSSEINTHFQLAFALGYEGIVIAFKDYEFEHFMKVKANTTIDVMVIGLNESKSLITKHGNVSSGFTKAEKAQFSDALIGQIIEVRCMELTRSNQFRHPVFVRFRPDLWCV